MILLAGCARHAQVGPESTAVELQDLVKATDNLCETTVELRGLVDDLESGAAKNLLAEVNTTSTALIDRITLRGLLLIGALVVGLVLYRVIVALLVPSTRR